MLKVRPPSVRRARLFGIVLGALLCVSCSPRRDAVYVGFLDAPVAAVSVSVSGQIVELKASEGTRVRKGQILAQLESRERAAAVKEAEANVERAADALREAERNTQAVAPTLRGAEADIARAQAELEDARIHLERTEHLAHSGAAPASELDPARARYLSAQATLQAMGASRSVSRGRIGAAHAAVSTARAALHASQAALDLARVQLQLTEVRSPSEGLIVEQNLQAGEWAAPGTPVLTVEDLSRQWVRIDVEETNLGAMRIGQAASVRVLAFPERRYTGHVIEVGAEGEFALNRDVRRGRPDIRTFRVRIGLDRIADELRPGMTAEVELARSLP